MFIFVFISSLLCFSNSPLLVILYNSCNHVIMICFVVLCALRVALSWTVPCFRLEVALPCLADRFPGRTLRLWLFSDVLQSQPQERSPLDHVPSFNSRLVFLSRSLDLFSLAFNKKKLFLVLLCFLQEIMRKLDSAPVSCFIVSLLFLVLPCKRIVKRTKSLLC